MCIETQQGTLSKNLKKKKKKKDKLFWGPLSRGMLGSVDLQFVNLEDRFYVLLQNVGKLATELRCVTWQKSEDLKCNVPEEWNLE